MLIAAAGGVGYGIGREVDGDAAGTDDSTVEAGSVGAGDSSLDEQPATTQAAVEETPTTLLAAAEEVDGEREGALSDDAGLWSSGAVGYAPFGTQPMETLFEHATDDRFLVRVQLGQTWPSEIDVDWGAGAWRPAPWCFESGQLRVSITGNGIVDVGGVPWYAEPFEKRSVSWVLLGGNDGNPQWVIVAQAPPDATNVRVVFADGSTDEVAPVGGIAALVAAAPPSTLVDEGGSTYWIEPSPAFEVTFEGGAAPVVIDSEGVGDWDDPEFRASCTPPPPALPEAGEQPADPTAAEAEIRALMASLYGADGEDVDRSALLDDATGVAEAREQVQAGGYAQDAANARATIDELVFTAPEEAWFRYSIDTPGNDFDARYGIAVTVDGVWKITRSTVCQDLMLAGGDCGGGWESIYPPGD